MITTEHFFNIQADLHLPKLELITERFTQGRHMQSNSGLIDSQTEWAMANESKNTHEIAGYCIFVLLLFDRVRW